MQRQAMGVALHIVLLPFLNYCIAQFDSYDADLIKSAFFLPADVNVTPPRRAFPFCDASSTLNVSAIKEEATMHHLYQTTMSDPVPIDPVPVPDPIPTPQPVPDPPSPDPRPIDDPPPHMR